MQLVCEATESSVEQIMQKGRKRDLAKEMAIYLARDLSGISGKELGEFFSAISGAGNNFAIQVIQSKASGG